MTFITGKFTAVNNKCSAGINCPAVITASGIIAGNGSIDKRERAGIINRTAFFCGILGKFGICECCCTGIINRTAIAILSLPAKAATELVVPIINAGIKGVLNFTSAPLNFPQGIVVENYDITTILEKVAYFVKAAEENEANQ